MACLSPRISQRFHICTKTSSEQQGQTWHLTRSSTMTRFRNYNLRKPNNDEFASIFSQVFCYFHRYSFAHELSTNLEKTTRPGKVANCWLHVCEMRHPPLTVGQHPTQRWKPQWKKDSNECSRTMSKNCILRCRSCLDSPTCKQYYSSSFGV